MGGLCPPMWTLSSEASMRQLSPSSCPGFCLRYDMPGLDLLLRECLVQASREPVSDDMMWCMQSS